MKRSLIGLMASAALACLCMAATASPSFAIHPVTQPGTATNAAASTAVKTSEGAGFTVAVQAGAKIATPFLMSASCPTAALRKDVKTCSTGYGLKALVKGGDGDTEGHGLTRYGNGFGLRS